MKVSIFMTLLLLATAATQVTAQTLLSEDLTPEILAGILLDGFKPHESAPLGVPSSYDWANKPRVGAGNIPNGFTAATGWGQVFYTQKNQMSQRSAIFVRRFQTYLCQNSANGYQWSVTQSGELDGAQFRADFAENASQSVPTFSQKDGEAEITFDKGSAFHFWPHLGRFNLPSSNLCGILVLLQAKQDASEAGNLLIGLGADYWTTISAKWDNYKTNKDIAIGRLRVVGQDWKWVGMTTANIDALKVLKQQGFTNETSPKR